MAGAAGAASKLEAGIAGVQGDSKAARNLTINISSLMSGDIVIQTSKVEQGTAQVRAMVNQALLDAVRDVEVAY